jgi:hypothetical protein
MREVNSMSAQPNYSQLLRPIGEVLESLGVQSFVLTAEGDDFSVRGHKPRSNEKKALRSIWSLLSGKESCSGGKPTPSSDVLDLRYTRDDIARLEGEAKGKRNASASGGAPQPNAISQILRACGAFVDQKQGRILAVKKADDSITIEYESYRNEKVSDQFTVASLYDFYVNMYLKRRDRSRYPGR